VSNLAVNDAPMRDTGSGKPEKVGIVGENDSLIRDGKIKVLQVTRLEQACLRSGCHVNAPLPQSFCDSWVTVLIQVEPGSTLASCCPSN